MYSFIHYLQNWKAFITWDFLRWPAVVEIELSSLKEISFIFHVLRELSHWASFSWNNAIRLLLICLCKFISIFSTSALLCYQCSWIYAWKEMFHMEWEAWAWIFQRKYTGQGWFFFFLICSLICLIKFINTKTVN